MLWTINFEGTSGTSKYCRCVFVVRSQHQPCKTKVWKAASQILVSTQLQPKWVFNPSLKSESYNTYRWPCKSVTGVWNHPVVVGYGSSLGHPLVGTVDEGYPPNNVSKSTFHSKRSEIYAHAFFEATTILENSHHENDTVLTLLDILTELGWNIHSMASTLKLKLFGAELCRNLCQDTCNRLISKTTNINESGYLLMNTMILVYNIQYLSELYLMHLLTTPLISIYSTYFFSDTLPPPVFFGHPKLVAHSTKGQ